MDDCGQNAVADSKAGDSSQPPALPVKQRRSHCSGSCSPGSSVGLGPDADPSPFASRSRALSRVAATECQAPECPIHRGSGQPGAHTVRFLSDSTPPPLPKKRLSRALSLPGGVLSPQCPHHCRDANYTCTAAGQDAALRSLESHLALLSFDTPDSELPGFFKNFQNEAEVSLDIQERHLLFLRSGAQKLARRLLCEEESPAMEAESLDLADLVLQEGRPPTCTTHSIFYPILCPKFPGRTLAAKVFKRSAEPALPESLPPHINIQQVIAHFPRSPKQRVLSDKEEGAQNSPEGASPPGVPLPSPQCTASPCGNSTEPHGNVALCASGRTPTVLTLMPEGHVAAIVTEVPAGTLEDFVREGVALHRSAPELYERRLALLLLQVTQGLQHLRSHSAACADLQPQSIALVWPDRETAGVQADRAAETAEAEGRTAADELEGSIQMLWRKRGTPRAVLAEFQHPPDSSEELRLSCLLQRCLHVSETPLVRNTPGSPYSHGLLQLASALAEGHLKLPAAPGVLQALLWGPRAKILQRGPALLPSWLAVKRSLLVLKMAERGVRADRRSLDWEDYLCLQYHCFTPTEILWRSSSIILGRRCPAL